MPIGIPDEWRNCLFRIIDEVDSFQIVTLGIRETDQTPSIESQVFYRKDKQRELLPLEIRYDTHEDAEAGHLSLVHLALLAEDPTEFAVLFNLARKNIPTSDLK